MIAFKTQALNPDPPEGINLSQPWMVINIGPHDNASALANSGWYIMSEFEYAAYCDSVGSAAEASFAVDMDNTDQELSAEVTKVIASRVLWDKTAVYRPDSGQFIPDRDGVFNINGTITVRDFVNVSRVSLDIYRNEEIWFTVYQRNIEGDLAVAMAFSCDADGYKSSEHYFDLRVRLDAIDSESPVSATVSGSDEETAWGATFQASLSGESPTG